MWMNIDKDQKKIRHEYLLIVLVFFFQAEDGIRDYKVTGVQTCAVVLDTIEDYSALARVEHCRYLFGDLSHIGPRCFKFYRLILSLLAHVQHLVLGRHRQRLWTFCPALEGCDRGGRPPQLRWAAKISDGNCPSERGLFIQCETVLRQDLPIFLPLLYETDICQLSQISVNIVHMSLCEPGEFFRCFPAINQPVDTEPLRSPGEDEATPTDEFLEVHTRKLQNLLVLLAVFDQKTGFFPRLPRAGDTSG